MSWSRPCCSGSTSADFGPRRGGAAARRRPREPRCGGGGRGGGGAAEPRPPPPPMPEPPVAAPEVPGDDAVVRVRFERVAGQLPAAAFTLPLDRVGESLREPHWITVPRRVVLAQLPEGAVQVDWAIVASQFPSLAFAVTDVEFRGQYPHLQLTLPLDDGLRQLPRAV